MARKKKAGQQERYLILVGHNCGQWEAFHVGRGTSTGKITNMLTDLKKQYPGFEVRLYLCETGIVLKPTEKGHQPRWITHPAKKMVSSACVLEENEVTAICNMCGAVGPTVTKDAEGNEKLAQEGWHKETGEGDVDIFSMSMLRPRYTLRCPSCDEQVARKNTKEDWF